MTPDRLSYLASRAANGWLTASEQRECMELIRELAVVADRQMMQLSDWQKSPVGLTSLYWEFAAAATLPPISQRCEVCGGSGAMTVTSEMIER